MHFQPLYEALLWGASFYLLNLFSGLGLARILFRKKPREYDLFFAPWLGVVLIGIVLTVAGFLDIGAGHKLSILAVIGTALAFFLISLFYPKPLQNHPGASNRWLGIAVIFIAAVCALFPAFTKPGPINSFTAGNNDVLDYSASARLFQKGGLKPFIEANRRTMGLNPYLPEWQDLIRKWDYPASAHQKKMYAFLGYLPRWLPIYSLAFFSTAARLAPEAVYSIVSAVLFAMFLPLVWLFARDVLKMEGRSAVAGFFLACVNPHILYIHFHGFLPQIMGTGFLICFLILFPLFIENQHFDFGEFLSVAMAACGLFMSYQQLVPFVGFASVLYAARLSLKFGLPGFKLTALKIGGVVIACALLAPYHAWRFIPLTLSEFTQSVRLGGWPITDRFYGLPYQLGAFLSPASIGISSPNMALEWMLNPFLIALAIYGIWKIERKAFVLLFLAPFALAALASFWQGKNYMYYKNFTLIYFLAPLLLAKGCFSLPFGSLKIPAMALLCAIGLTAALKSAERIRIMSRQGLMVPGELSALSNEDIKADKIFASGLNRWEALWASYYSGDKTLLLPFEIQAESLQTGSPIATNLVLARSQLRTVLDPNCGREIETSHSVGPSYNLYTFRGPALTPSVRLGEGFYEIEKNESQEWAWSQKVCEILIESPRDIRDASLNIEVESRQDQTLIFTLNESKPQKAAGLKSDGRNKFQIHLSLKAGENRLLFKTDGRELPTVAGDPRRLDMKFFAMKFNAD